MKSKKECLLFFEFLTKEIKNLSFSDIKHRYRDLTSKYNTDNGSEKNEDKHRELIETYNILKILYQQDDEKFEVFEIQTTHVNLVQETEGLFPGQIYVIDYKNNCSCMIWSPHWRSETSNRFEVGILGYAFCTEIKLIKYNTVPLLKKPIIIASKISTNISQSELENILLNHGIKLMIKKKRLDYNEKEIEQVGFNF